MTTLRKLTQEEKTRIWNSAKQVQEFNNSNGHYLKYTFDPLQTLAVRYTMQYGTKWIHSTIDNLNEVEVEVESHICNVIGNTNYTKTYINI